MLSGWFNNYLLFFKTFSIIMISIQSSWTTFKVFNHTLYKRYAKEYWTLSSTWRKKKKNHIKIKFSIVSRTINNQKSLKAFLICPQSCSVTDMFLPKDTNFWMSCLSDSQCSPGISKLSNNPYCSLPRTLKNKKPQKLQNLPISSFRDYNTRWKPRSLSSCKNTLSLPKYSTNLSI